MAEGYARLLGGANRMLFWRDLRQADGAGRAGHPTSEVI